MKVGSPADGSSVCEGCDGSEQRISLGRIAEEVTGAIPVASPRDGAVVGDLSALEIAQTPPAQGGIGSERNSIGLWSEGPLQEAPPFEALCPATDDTRLFAIEDVFGADWPFAPLPPQGFSELPAAA